MPEAIRTIQAALDEGQSIVVGLQSTGEARTSDALKEQEEEDLEQFVNAPQVTPL